MESEGNMGETSRGARVSGNAVKDTHIFIVCILTSSSCWYPGALQKAARSPLERAPDGPPPRGAFKEPQGINLYVCACESELRAPLASKQHLAVSMLGHCPTMRGQE